MSETFAAKRLRKAFLIRKRSIDQRRTVTKEINAKSLITVSTFAIAVVRTLPSRPKHRRCSTLLMFSFSPISDFSHQDLSPVSTTRVNGPS